MKHPFIYIIALIHTSLVCGQITFDDNFESGSIGSYTLLSQEGDSTYHYSVRTKFDPQSRRTPTAYPSARWFYFRMCGVKGRTIALDIKYNDSKRPFYSYDNITFTRFGEEHAPLLDSTITMRYERDTAYIAYFPPYTLSRSERQIERCSAKENCISFEVGKSPEHRPLRALIITEDAHSSLIPSRGGEIKLSPSDQNKKVIYIHGRIHPSETPSSWHLEAMIDTLLGDSKLAQHLRQQAIFYIMPITNPDGVYSGLSRTNTKGINLEVNYNRKVGRASHEVKSIKRLFSAFRKSNITPTLVLNMHSQSTPKVCYWIHSHTSTSKGYNLRQMLMGSLTAWDNPYFDFEELSHSSLKDIFLEHYIFTEFDEQTTALTFETPYSFYHKNTQGEWVSLDNLKHLAQISLRSIAEFLEWQP